MKGLDHLQTVIIKQIQTVLYSFFSILLFFSGLIIHQDSLTIGFIKTATNLRVTLGVESPKKRTQDLERIREGRRSIGHLCRWANGVLIHCGKSTRKPTEEELLKERWQCVGGPAFGID